MKTSLFAGFNNAVRSMQHAQHALNVHSINIANTNDPSFTRRVILPPSNTQLNGPGIARMRDAFIDTQYRQATGSLGEAEIRRNVLSKVEDMFGDPVEGGLRKAIDEFFDGWQALAESPADGVARIQVLSGGRMLAQQIKSTYDKLISVETTVNEELVTRVDEVNNALGRIFDLNKRITDLRRGNADDAGLRDEQDAVLDQLAKLIGATSMPAGDGTVRVMVGSTVLVDGPTKAHLKLEPGADGLQPVWEAYGSPPFSGTGTIGGLVSVRDGELRQLKSDIAGMAEALRTEVNRIHRAGYPVGGLTGGPLDFFVSTGAPADIVVNPALSPELIQAGGSAEGAPGDGENARALARLADLPMLDSVILQGERQSMRAYYRNLVGWIGSRAHETGRHEDVAKVHQRANEQQRMSNWGVSLDEEVAGLTMQQKSFAAAARVISVMDEMIDTLINRTGQ